MPFYTSTLLCTKAWYFNLKSCSDDVTDSLKRLYWYCKERKTFLIAYRTQHTPIAPLLHHSRTSPDVRIPPDYPPFLSFFSGWAQIRHFSLRASPESLPHFYNIRLRLSIKVAFFMGTTRNIRFGMFSIFMRSWYTKSPVSEVNDCSSSIESCCRSMHNLSTSNVCDDLK